MSEHKSRYSQKQRSKNRMYAPGKPGSCCANSRETVQIHNGPIKVEGRWYKGIHRVPMKFLPIFTAEKTRRTRL